jgi:aspartyl protease family protein
MLGRVSLCPWQSLMLGRLLVILAALAVIALAAPSVMPGLLATVVGQPAGGDATADAAPVPAATPDAAPGYARQAMLRADRLGHFAANAVVNGRSIEMLVDTGASIVALTPASARRLGIHPAASEYSLRMSTANGLAIAAPVMLDEIRIGDVVVRGVPAVVFSGNGLDVDLLGMTFLKRLSRFEAGNGQLVLVQ